MKKQLFFLSALLSAAVFVYLIFGVCFRAVAYADENTEKEVFTAINIEVLEDNGNVLMDGGITFNSAIIKVNEELALFEMTRTPFGDKSEVMPVAYTYGELITEPGYYEFNARNTRGNKMNYKFYVVDTLINQHFIYKRPTGYKFNSLKRNGFDAYVDDDMDRIVFDADGDYEVQIENFYDGRKVDYFISIDTLPPTINTTGLISGSTVTPNSVTVESVSDDCVKLVVTRNGKEIDYDIGDILNINGEYIFSAIDKAGNQTEIKFTLKKTINLIYVLFGALIGVVTVIGIGYYADKRRKRRIMEAIGYPTNHEEIKGESMKIITSSEMNNQNVNRQAEDTINVGIEHSEERTKVKAEDTNSVVFEFRKDNRTTLESTDNDNVGRDVCVLELATSTVSSGGYEKSLIETEQYVYKQEKKTPAVKVKSAVSHKPKRRMKNVSANFKEKPANVPVSDASSGAERSRIDKDNSASDNKNDDN